jgi:hypothetical protein
VSLITMGRGRQIPSLLPTVYMLILMPVLLLSVSFKALIGEHNTDAGADLCSMFYLDGLTALCLRFATHRQPIRRLLCYVDLQLA